MCVILNNMSSMKHLTNGYLHKKRAISKKFPVWGRRGLCLAVKEDRKKSIWGLMNCFARSETANLVPLRLTRSKNAASLEYFLAVASLLA